MLIINYLILIIGLIDQFKYANCVLCTNPESKVSVQVNEPCFDLQHFDYQLNKKVQQEKRIELECFVKNKGDYSVAWLYENQLISLNGMIVKPIANIKVDTDLKKKFNLVISNVDASQKGSYTCQIISTGINNLDYVLDVLVPPTITRIQNDDVIMLKEGESITVQCLTQGNPRPKLTWSKKGEKADHTTIDETKSTLNLQNVDETHSDTYSCTAKNGVGNPVSSEFQILVKYKPRVVLSEQENINQSVMYTGVGRKEVIICRISSFPEPKVSLLLNDEVISPELYTFEENKNIDKQYILTYNFIGSEQLFGNYSCIAENELGSNSVHLKVTGMPSDITINSDKLPLYSDAVLFEWSLYSGSPIQELNVQVFSTSNNNTNVTNLHSKTKQMMSDGSESPPTYHNDLIMYKDFYDVSKLHPNSTYVVRLRVKNELNEWSEWSQNLTLRTHSDENEKITKHKSIQMHHHRHHDKKHKNFQQQSGSRDLNSKRDRFNAYISDENSAIGIRNSLIFNLTAIITCISSLLIKFYNKL